MNNKAKIYLSELKAICNIVSQREYYDKEIGGDIYGVWTDQGMPIIYLVTGPGKLSVSYERKFTQDIDYTMDVENYLFNHYGLQYLGDWHSHHILGLSRPSYGDGRRIANLLKKNNRKRMCEFIVTHNYDKKNIENISAFFYEKKEKVIMKNLEINFFSRQYSIFRYALEHDEKKIVNMLNANFDDNLISINGKMLKNNKKEDIMPISLENLKIFWKDII